MATGGNTPEARLAAAEHQRHFVLMRIRGNAFDAIGKQLGMTRQAAHLLYKKALKLTPKADEEMRKLEAERNSGPAAAPVVEASGPTSHRGRLAGVAG
jgi:sulfopyruvate decarboxylase TPP-binding subunit